MRNVVLYIAMSLDGYIADARGGVDWLGGQDSGGDTGDSYDKFIRTVDTVVMGWRTYHQIRTELSPDQWVYDNLHSYIITHRSCVSERNITFVAAAPGALIRELKEKKGKDIWICGGGDIVRQLMEDRLIDRYHISVIPTILGKGIPLFSAMEEERKLQLLDCRTDNGITELVYENRRQSAES